MLFDVLGYSIATSNILVRDEGWMRCYKARLDLWSCSLLYNRTILSHGQQAAFVLCCRGPLRPALRIAVGMGRNWVSQLDSITCRESFLGMY